MRVAAANLDEDLDWRLASQAKNDTALHAFLAKHPRGAHAPEAQMALDKIIAPPGSVLSTAATNARRSAAANFARGRGRRQRAAATRRVREAKERAPPQSQAIIIKWKHERQRTQVQWRYARPRYQPATAAAKPVSGAVRTTDAATMACAAMTVQAASSNCRPRSMRAVAVVLHARMKRKAAPADAEPPRPAPGQVPCGNSI